MRNEEKRRQINIKLPGELIEQIDSIAQQDRISRTKAIEHALRVTYKIPIPQ